MLKRRVLFCFVCTGKSEDAVPAVNSDKEEEIYNLSVVCLDPDRSGM